MNNTCGRTETLQSIKFLLVGHWLQCHLQKFWFLGKSIVYCTPTHIVHKMHSLFVFFDYKTINVPRFFRMKLCLYFLTGTVVQREHKVLRIRGTIILWYICAALIQIYRRPSIWAGSSSITMWACPDRTSDRKSQIEGLMVHLGGSNLYM